MLTYHSSLHYTTHPLLTKQGRNHLGPATALEGVGPLAMLPLGRVLQKGGAQPPEAVAVLVVVADLEQGQGREECQHP